MRISTRSTGHLPFRRLLALGFACAVPLAAFACSGGDNTTAAKPPAAPAPPAEAATANPVDAAAEEVAAGFLEAFGAFDADRAITYLADDADLSGLDSSLVGWRVPGAPTDDFRLFVAWHEAVGYKQMLHPCERVGNATSFTQLRCPFDVHSLRSDEIGLGPYSGSQFNLAVRDGEIVRASWTLSITEFSPQVWEPFERWVRTAYPEDAAIMYGPENTEESISLWEQRTREYVEEVA